VRNLLDFVSKSGDGYMLVRKLPRKTFAQLCRVMGRHGYRYAGKGIFKTARNKTNEKEEQA
jgi:hypothetical protein